MSISGPQGKDKNPQKRNPRELKADQEIRNYILLEKLPGGAVRREIMQLLRKPKNCNELAKKLGVNWTTIAFHLKKLVDANLVQEIKYGKHTYYQIRSKGTNP
jgi:predicted transcriptional regulator